MEFAAVGVLVVVWLGMVIAAIGGMAVGLAALISVARLPPESFGPWWDNTKTPWLLGLAVSYMVPFGMLVTGIYWFRSGRPGVASAGIAGRPFWMGPPKPAPPAYPMQPPYPLAPEAPTGPPAPAGAPWAPDAPEDRGPAGPEG